MIEKITDHNLERYDSRLKEWCDRKFFEKGNYGKYETTEEAGAVAFYPAPDTPLEGKVKFSFKETPPASGDKGPENPSKIEGVSLIHCSLVGEDLLDQSDIEFSAGMETHSESVSEDGWIKLYAKNESSSYKFLAVRHKLKSDIIFDANKTYKIHLEIRSLSATTSPFAGLAVALDVYSNTDLEIHPIYWVSNTSVIAPAVIELSPSTAANFDTGDYAFTDRIQCNPAGGEMSIEYRVHLVEYAGTNNEKMYSAITLPSTYYGGTVDLATGVMTVTHKAVVLTGSESWNSQTFNEYLRCYIAIDFHRVENLLCSCTHYQVGYGVDKAYINTLSGNAALFIGTDGTLEDLKAFLAEQYANGTPVVFVAQVPESEYQIVQLTPQQILSLSQTDKYTPRLNTVYTDVDSIQISYLKSPIRDEYEKTQAILSLGGNS